MFKAKINKWWISIALIFLFILPVSADYKAMTLLDSGWGLGSQYDTGVGNGTITRYLDGAGYSYNSYVEIFTYWSIPIQSGYTYKLTFQLNTDYAYYTTSPSGTFKTSGKQSQNTNLTDTLENATVSITKDGSTYYVTVIFSQEKSNLPVSDIMYIYQFIDNDIRYSATVSGIGAAAYYDPGAAGYTQELVDMVAQMQQQDQEFYTNALEVLDNIKSEQQNTNQKLDEMPSKIDEVLQNDAEREKAEATSSGNENISAATDALTNAFPVSSLKDAISPLLTACSYEGITSVWTFPAIKIPALSGLINETQLSEDINFDLCSYADQYIPDALLTLIRSVNTVLLILWAAHELMNLTTKLLGGDNTE